MEGELNISHSDMNAAHRRGHAVLLDQSIPWLARYQDSWWVVYAGGWLRVTDELAAADINDRLRRTAGASAAEDDTACSPGRPHVDSP
jgi:hypothetical protein